MSRYFHVAPADYHIGDDLLCRDELEAEGRLPVWKFDGEPFDTDVVCLFSTHAEAVEFVRDFLSDGIVLAVNLHDAEAWGLRLTRVDEGFTAAFGRIPAHLVTVA
jgi:hypothetical protein